ncbi:hypothetical protein [Streptomyces dysideae]|uniref:Uncharacterized protein n=1 Tax=Streptomyces dysideae TaxID=909626 RepID=A0A101UYQ0_9ACTN|nr:hypothetical protein [Streptomyces dysideae]KUO19289.1 hypothetical protein AQJ91_20180 [Streptomyces dysideae]
MLRAAEDEAAALLAAAEREAVAVRERARSRSSVLADRVVALALEELAAEEASPAPPEGYRAFPHQEGGS